MLNDAGRRRHAAIGPLLAVVASAGLCWLLVQVRPERLRALSTPEFPIACRNGWIVSVGKNSNRLQGLPMREGRSRTLTPHFGTPGTLRATFYTDLGVVIRSEEQEPAPEPVGASRHPFEFNPGRLRARLWEVALDGRPAHELLPQVRMTQAVASGENCYWLSPGAARATPAAEGRPWNVAAWRNGELRVTPLRGDGSRLIATRLSLFTRLEPLGRGVSWSVPRRGTLRGDRYLALPPDYEVHVVPDCTGAPELLAGRLYWFDQRLGLAAGAPVQPELKLVSATLDGEDRRELLDLAGNPKWDERGRLLGVHQEKLYALLYRRPTKAGMPDRPVLCEVRGESIREVAALRSAIGFTWLESGYLYYTAEELQENWLDWTPKGLATKRTQVLYRTRLVA